MRQRCRFKICLPAVGLFSGRTVTGRPNWTWLLIPWTRWCWRICCTRAGFPSWETPWRCGWLIITGITWFIFRRKTVRTVWIGIISREVTTRIWSIIFMTRSHWIILSFRRWHRYVAITGRQLLIISCFITGSWFPVPCFRIRRIIIRELTIFSLSGIRSLIIRRLWRIIICCTIMTQNVLFILGEGLMGHLWDIVTRWKIHGMTWKFSLGKRGWITWQV